MGSDQLGYLTPFIGMSALALVMVWFQAACIKDIRGADDVRYLSRRAWIIACLVPIPVGGFVYLGWGRWTSGETRYFLE